VDVAGALLTAFGWLLVIKGAACFLVPDPTLHSMERGGRSPGGFVAGGVALLLVGGGHAIACGGGRAMTDRRAFAS
jgi:hypothetical protein